MKWYHKLLAMTASIALIFIILITSFELAAYGGYGFYEKEYQKYNVTRDLQMELPDVMHVTKEMMAYLKGNRETLCVQTTVNGQEQDFFNEQDRFHMEDVQHLFIGGLRLRTAAIVILIAAVALLVLLKGSWKKLLPMAYGIGLIIFLALAGILAVLFSQDFTKYFTIFHEIFFTNDLWMFDPETDLMIRMLPEGFFFDMAARIVIMFVSGLALFGGISLVGYRLGKKKID